MIRKLLIVFASGLVLSIALLSAAWVIGGDEAITRIRNDYGGWSFRHRHDEGDRRHDRRHGPIESRTFAFDGKRILTIDAPVTLKFVRGAEARMTVEGPGRIVDRLRWDGARLSLGGHRPWHAGPIEVTIAAPQLPGLVLNGASDIDLVALDQPSLTIDAHGAVDLEASGRVRRLAVSSHGAGDLDLQDVEAQDATVRIAGVGDVDISASGNVDARIAGAGDISLHRKPAALTSEISGFGSINHDY